MHVFGLKGSRLYINTNIHDQEEASEITDNNSPGNARGSSHLECIRRDNLQSCFVKKVVYTEKNTFTIWVHVADMKCGKESFEKEVLA